MHTTAHARPDWRTAMTLAHALGAEAAVSWGRIAGGTAPPSGPSRATVSLPLREAAGQILAEDLATPIPVPHYASSAMDGFAYSGGGPWALEEWTGVDHVLTPGRACAVVTGRVVPEGTTGIIRSEYAYVDEAGDRSELHGPRDLRADDREPSTGKPLDRGADAQRTSTGHLAHRVLGLAPAAPESELRPGSHIRPAGAEAAAGELIARAGTTLTPPLLAMAAVCGHDCVRVTARPRASLLYTGDEVVSSGTPAPGTVRDAFSIQLPHLLALSGAEVTGETRIRDDAVTTREALTQILASGTDTIVTTGGTGRSETDHIRSTLVHLAHETGGHVVFDELGMRPGHPTVLVALRTGAGRLVPVIGLPGNPLAAMAAMRVAGRALLRGMSGTPPEAPLTVPVARALPAQKVERLAPAVPASPEGEEGIPAPPSREPGEQTATRDEASGEAFTGGAPGETAWLPCTHTGSNMMRGLAWAQGWLVLPARAVSTGERVPFLPPEW